jgi:phosphatidylglycerol:prolipoprotein diacylglycerol transferase
MVLTEWSYYREYPREIFSLSTFLAGGVFYGGFLAALIFVIWYVRVQKLSFWKLTDVLAPGVALGQSVGRLGCFSAGCDYGKATTAPWGVVFSSTFAHEVTGVPLGVRLHPAQLYESLATLAIFGVLLWWFPKKKRDGDVSLAYVGLYAGARFFLEFLRGDEDRGFVFHHLLSTSQFIALLAVAGIAVVFIWRLAHRGKDLSAGPEGTDERRIPAAEATPGGFGRAQKLAAASVSKRAKH